MSKKAKMRVRVGNFILTQEERAKGYVIVCSALSGQWRVVWGDRCMMYGIVLDMMREGNAETLHGLLFILFAASSHIHSTDFYVKLNGLIVEELSRLEEAREADADADEKALKQVGDIVEMENELERLEEEGVDV